MSPSRKLFTRRFENMSENRYIKLSIPGVINKVITNKTKKFSQTNRPLCAYFISIKDSCQTI